MSSIALTKPNTTSLIVRALRAVVARAAAATVLRRERRCLANALVVSGG